MSVVSVGDMKRIFSMPCQRVNIVKRRKCVRSLQILKSCQISQVIRDLGTLDVDTKLKFTMIRTKLIDAYLYTV